MRSNNNQGASAVNSLLKERTAPFDPLRASGSAVLRAILETPFDARPEFARKWPPISLPPHNQTAARVPQNLPAEIAFLVNYGVGPGILMAAAETARAQGVTADAVLLAEGTVGEHFFYSSLARHLRLAFVEGRVALGPDARYPQSIRAGLVSLAAPRGPAFLAAPCGAAIARLIQALRPHSETRGRLALTTPTHLQNLIRGATRNDIARQASFALWSRAPALCAYEGASFAQKYVALGFVAAVGAALVLAPNSASLAGAILLGLAFVAVIWMRLAACWASINLRPLPSRPLSDADLPIYSIVIALYRKARVVPQLVAALNDIDYPRAKLDIKFVIEEDDRDTFRALINSGRRGCEIIVAPAGAPRTKPRALNVALPLLRGRFVAVFDAEDMPDPGQIRLAAQHFAAAPPQLACLQAQLSIDNAGDAWLTRGMLAQTRVCASIPLTRLFAIEYAALFDVINVGLGALRLPFPLGGSSNHFRAAVLRGLRGWDAWNVTEDADIGLRLARFGYYADVLPSTTHEEAPPRLGEFLGQRRRWCKGWYQTLIVLCRNPRRLFLELGAGRFCAALLVLLSYALAPLIGPLCGLGLAADFLCGRLSFPTDPLQIAAATLWIAVFTAGIPAILWPAIQGMKRRALLGLWPWLLLLPVYSLLICYAAWMSIYDLLKRPQHWHKTEHGLARTSRRRPTRA